MTDKLRYCKHCANAVIPIDKTLLILGTANRRYNSTYCYIVGVVSYIGYFYYTVDIVHVIVYVISNITPSMSNGERIK